MVSHILLRALYKLPWPNFFSRSYQSNSFLKKNSIQKTFNEKQISKINFQDA